MYLKDCQEEIFLTLIKYFTLSSFLYIVEYLISLLTEYYLIKILFILIHIVLIRQKFCYSEFIFDLFFDLVGKKHERIFARIGNAEFYVNNILGKASNYLYIKLKNFANLFLMDMVKDMIFKKDNRDDEIEKTKKNTTVNRSTSIQNDKKKNSIDLKDFRDFSKGIKLDFLSQEDLKDFDK
jgi:hypothetical protein